MRLHHAIAVAAVILIGLGAKLLFFSPPTAEADARAVKSFGMDVSQMHQNMTLPAQKMHDMTFVFSDGD